MRVGKRSFLVIPTVRMRSWETRIAWFVTESSRETRSVGKRHDRVRIRVYSNYWLSNRRFIVARSLRTVSSVHLIETRTSWKNSLEKKLPIAQVDPHLTLTTFSIRFSSEFTSSLIECLKCVYPHHDQFYTALEVQI